VKVKVKVEAEPTLILKLFIVDLYGFYFY
jgi:hypothetical protein